MIRLLLAFLFMPTPPTYVVAPSNIQNTYFAVAGNDFAYAFTRGAARWMCLYAFYNNPTADKKPAIFKSVDSGVSWALMDDAGAPIADQVPWNALAYDIYFNQVNPISQSAITFMWADNFPTFVFPDHTDHYHLTDFSLDAGMYGSPYGDVSITNVEDPLFSKRPDGNMIMVYTRGVGGNVPIMGTYFQIYSGGGWGGEQPLRVDGVQKFVSNLVVDSTSAAHVAFVDVSYRISSSGVVSGPFSLPVASTGNGNLSIVGSSLVMPVFSSGLFLLTGTPLSAPVWTSQSITTGSIGGVQGTMWYANQNGAYNLSVEDEGALDDVMVTTDLTASGPTLHWAAADWQSVGRSVKSGSVWGAPVTVWTPVGSPGTPLRMFSVCARGGIGGPVARYRGY